MALLLNKVMASKVFSSEHTEVVQDLTQVSEYIP